MSRVAFLGVGAMGLPMAGHVTRAGHTVSAYDPSTSQLQRVAELGASPSASAASAVEDADVVVVMVATPAQLMDVLRGSHGVAKKIPKGATCVVMSTVGVEALKEAQQVLAPNGVVLVDAPVTGGAAGAEAGTLTILVGAAPHDLEGVRGVLECMGRVAECGSNVGDGQAVKLVNQLLCSVHLVAASEALAFAKALGLDPSAVLDIVAGGAAGSWMLNDRGPRMLSTDAPVRSTVDIFVKDSSLVAHAAAEAGFDAPVLKAAAEQLRQASSAGLGREDDSRVIRTYETQASS